MAGIEFAAVDESDFEALAALRIAAMRESLERIGRFDPVRARERLLSGFSPGHARHILVEGERVGFVVLKPQGGALLLDHLYVKPGSQGRGTGASVLARVFEEADAAALPMRVGVLRESDANRFYARHGFKLVERGEFDNYYVRPAKFVSDPNRKGLLREIAGRILGVSQRDVVRVAIDGVDGAGKTVFADELAAALQESGAKTIRASVDGFHNGRSIRYRRGRSSPEGFFADSYDYAQLRSVLLDPLSPGGNRRYRVAVFDHRTDSPVTASGERAEPGSILVFDGIFLHRAELRGYWDFSIFLQVAFHISIPRVAGRGEGSADVTAPENRRYVEGQQLYLRECQPAAIASVVVDNNDVAAPRIVG